MSRKYGRIIACVGWLAIIVLSLVPGHDRPHTGYSGVSEHFLAYALVALVYCWSADNWRNAIKFLAALVIGSAILEVAQLYIPGRNSEIVGVFSAAAGALSGTFIAAIVHRLFAAKT